MANQRPARNIWNYTIQGKAGQSTQWQAKLGARKEIKNTHHPTAENGKGRTDQDDWATGKEEWSVGRWDSERLKTGAGSHANQWKAAHFQLVQGIHMPLQITSLSVLLVWSHSPYLQGFPPTVAGDWHREFFVKECTTRESTTLWHWREGWAWFDYDNSVFVQSAA